MFCSNISAFLFVGVVAFVIVDSRQAPYLRTVKKTYSCGNDEFQHEEGSSGKWEKKEITYFIESFGTSMPEEDVRRGIENAFYLWANMVDLIFTKVDESDAADIVLGFESGEHGDNFPFNNGYFAENVKMAHCVGKMPCTAIHFDDDLYWRYVKGDGKWLDYRRVGEVLDFLTVAMHQIGHALGLEHIGNDGTRHEHADKESVNIMDKIYTRPAGRLDGYIWPRPRTGDARAIKALYQKVEDFQAMHKNCHNYWENHEWATYYNKTEKHYVIQQVENYPQAQNYCQAIGGSLVSIHSEEENLFIAKFGKEKLRRTKVAFIGLTRPDMESEWRWEDNTPVNYTNWNPNEPNNKSYNKWVVLDTQSENGGWRNVYDEWYFLAICQVQCPIEPTQDDGWNQFHKYIAKLYSSYGLFLL